MFTSHITGYHYVGAGSRYRKQHAGKVCPICHEVNDNDHIESEKCVETGQIGPSVFCYMVRRGNTVECEREALNISGAARPQYQPAPRIEQPAAAPKFVPMREVQASFAGYELSPLFQYAASVFGLPIEAIAERAQAYGVGVYHYSPAHHHPDAVKSYEPFDGGARFWLFAPGSIDTETGELTGAGWAKDKIIKYLPTGKRDKSMQASTSVKTQGKGYTAPGLFGGHLVGSGLPVHLVESEKTAFLMSIAYPQFAWIATGGATSFSPAQAAILAAESVTYFPDNDLSGLEGAEKIKKLIPGARIDKGKNQRRTFGNGADVWDHLATHLATHLTNQPAPQRIEPEKEKGLPAAPPPADDHHRPMTSPATLPPADESRRPAQRTAPLCDDFPWYIPREGVKDLYTYSPDCPF